MAPDQEPEVDMYSRFLQACRESHEYPYTLLRTPLGPLPGSLLKRYHSSLAQNSSDLCNESRTRIQFWDQWPGDQTCHRTEVNSQADLSEHVERKGEDPRCRHLFIESRHSRAPLDCSVAALKLILTFHQVDPFFLDHVFAFGRQQEPLDACWTHFKDHNTLDRHDNHPSLAPLGRSGREVRHSFLLRLVERTQPGGDSLWHWPIRQVAAYHSFDLSNGRSIWITVKGNGVMRERIMQDTMDLPVFRRSMTDESIVACFNASLATHLIYFQWCGENWRWFIRDIEEEIREKCTLLRTAAIDREPYFARLPRRTDSASSFVDIEAPPDRTDDGSIDAEKSMPDDAFVLGFFSYKDLQTLHSMGRTLEEARLVVELNHSTLKKVCRYYQHIVQSHSDAGDIPEDAKQGFRDSISRFIPKVESIMEDLEINLAQLTSLLRKLDADKTLLECILQFRSSQGSRVFEELAHENSIAMQVTSEATKLATHSTHVISFIAFCLDIIHKAYQNRILQCRASSTTQLA
ncbi:hypothetical protein B0H66DRAFT_528654 [Apodospora peruviana]|uniref:CorA-like transporter domain-containing protein n=1 Tax=Apodospora peruviana TaxID=516989 RepID=A0AAE0IUC4_9PEZI|nr:hypothetical protein B0H66DRAFT_528654 [Apodospora peruviana]